MKRIFCHMVLLLLFSSNVFCQVEEGDYIIFTFSKKLIPHYQSRAQKKSWKHMSCSRFRMYNWIANVDSIKNNPQFVIYPLSISMGEEICFSDEKEDMSSVTDKGHAQKAAKSRENDITGTSTRENPIMVLAGPLYWRAIPPLSLKTPSFLVPTQS